MRISRKQQKLFLLPAKTVEHYLCKLLGISVCHKVKGCSLIYFTIFFRFFLFFIYFFLIDERELDLSMILLP